MVAPRRGMGQELTLRRAMDHQKLIDHVRFQLNEIVAQRPEIQVKWLLDRINESDALVRRYLQSKKYNVDRTIKKLVSAFDFLCHHQIDKRHFFPELFILAPLVHHGQDREGNLVVYGR